MAGTSGDAVRVAVVVAATAGTAMSTEETEIGAGMVIAISSPDQRVIATGTGTERRETARIVVGMLA
jgi:hypothetical protein